MQMFECACSHLSGPESRAPDSRIEGISERQDLGGDGAIVSTLGRNPPVKKEKVGGWFLIVWVVLTPMTWVQRVDRYPRTSFSPGSWWWRCFSQLGIGVIRRKRCRCLFGIGHACPGRLSRGPNASTHPTLIPPPKLEFFEREVKGFPAICAPLPPWGWMRCCAQEERRMSIPRLLNFFKNNFLSEKFWIFSKIKKKLDSQKKMKLIWHSVYLYRKCARTQETLN